MLYTILKHIHMTTVVVTVILFNLRGVWMLQNSPRLQQRWIKVAPHINDTLLLVAAFGMVFLLGQYPFSTPWLTAKVLGLLAYIALGVVALHRGPTRAIRIGAWVAAMLTFVYLIAVAAAKDPWPFG